MLKIQVQVAVVMLLISASVKAVPFSEAWNFKNEKLSGKVKTVIFKHNSGGKTLITYNKKGEHVIILRKNTVSKT